MINISKILVGVSLIALVITVSSITIASKLVYQRTQDAKRESTLNVLNLTTGVYTASQVVSHSTSGDCWMIIDQKVYDLTRFLVSHPGGALVMTPYCGRDGTTAYQTKDRSPNSAHSPEAANLLTQFYLGPLGSDQILPTNPPIPSVVPSVVPSVGANSRVTKATSSLNSSTVASHSTSSDCWVTISNGIYNLTNYLVSHPGGVGAITPYCGKDGTTAFQTRGGNSRHSNYAYSLLNNYLVGSLGSSVTVNSTLSPSIPTTIRSDSDD